MHKMDVIKSPKLKPCLSQASTQLKNLQNMQWLLQSKRQVNN